MEILILKLIDLCRPMKRNFTLKLISFIYHETSAEENAEMIDRILSDGPSEDTYQELMEAKEMLDTVVLRPSPDSVNKILAYSREELEII